jgi:Ser/Thr protein kinase RdoA (MazF antagonist)
MSKELAQRILQRYGIADLAVAPLQKGYRSEVYTAGNAVNLIIYKREPDSLAKLKNANHVGNYTATHGLPARQTADDRIMQLRAGSLVKYGALYGYLPGKTIPWEAYTKEHIKQLGGTMSTMHAVLKNLERQQLPLVTDEYQAICKRMQSYFKQPGVGKALQNKLGLGAPQTLSEQLQLLRLLSKLKGQQALHMDFVRGNILFDKDANITGILDFEKTAWGHVAFDIARTLAFLLVDCKYKDEVKVRKYFLLSGYNKRGQNLFSSWKMLEALLDLFLVYDFYKFLRHNPYEFLEQNEHFIRTRDFLLKRNILTKTEMLQ